MPEQDNIFNTGVPMSNGIGGTVEQGSSSSGGGAPRPGNTNSAGASNTPTPSPPAAPGTNNPSGSQAESNVEYVKGAIDKYFGASALIFSFEMIVDIYIEKVLMFEALLQQYIKKAEEAGAKVEEIKQIKENFKKEKDALVEYYLHGPGKEELKKKFNELKFTIHQLKTTITSIPKDFAKMVAEATMPNVLGPVAPNPFSTVLKIYNGIVTIKRTLDAIFIALQTFISVAESLGVSKTKPFEEFMGVIATPLRALEGLFGKVKEKEESLSADLEMQGKIDEAKKGWSYPHANGKLMNAEQVEELARDDRFKMYQFPLTGGNRKDLKNFIKKDGTDWKARRADDAEIILKYDDWTNWMLAKLKNSQQAATSGGRVSTSNDAQLSGSTTLGTSEGAMGPSA
jgi:hypothetical protein